MKKRLGPLLILNTLLIMLAVCTPASAGILEWLSPGGVSGPFAAQAEQSTGAADWNSPAFLPDAAQRDFFETATRHDDLYHLQKDAATEYAISATGRRFAALGTLNPRNHRRQRTVFGIERSSEKLRAFTNGKISDTRFTASGHTLSMAAATRLGRWRAGFSSIETIWKAAGTSSQLSSSISVLGAGSTFDLKLRQTRNVSQIAYDTGRFGKFGVSYIETSMPLHTELSDGTDRFLIGAGYKEHSSGARWNAKLSETHTAAAFYESGDGSSVDRMYYNARSDFGTNTFHAGYRFTGIEIARRLSRASTATIGFSSYSGHYQGAGTFDLVDSFFGFLGGYYLYYPIADISYTGYSLSLTRARGRTSFLWNYSYRPTDVFIRFYGEQRILFTANNAVLQEYISDGLAIHTLTLGARRRISRDGYAFVTFTQNATTGGRLETAPAAAPGPAGPPQPERYKKVRGGQSVSFGLRYEF